MSREPAEPEIITPEPTGTEPYVREGDDALMVAIAPRVFVNEKLLGILGLREHSE